MPISALYDPGRLELMRALDLLRPHVDQSFDRVTALAATTTGRPTALITFLGPDGQWVGSRYGWDQPFHPLSESFCIHTLIDDQFVEVCDAAVDQRFVQNSLVTGKSAVRFYAGYPLKLGGYVLGALCLLDQTPGRLSEADTLTLERLAGLVCDLLKLRMDRARAEEARQKLAAVLEATKRSSA
jgi:GAF domain-containing protein